MNFMDLVGLFSRWVHIASTVTLLGGVVFARMVLTGPREIEMVTRYAKVLNAAIAGLLVSGLYNLLSKSAVPPGYHAVFGMKFLLALHVFAIAYLLGRPGIDEVKRRRHMTGVLISGGFVLALGAWLRWLTR